MPINRTSLLLTLACIFIPSLVFGTSIVGFRSPKRVLIAADGMATFGSGTRSEICKIIQAGSVYFAIAGLEHDSRPDRHYSPSQIILESFSASRSFTQLVDAVDKRMIEAGLTEVRDIKLFDPALYASASKDGSDDFTQILLAQIRNGKPYLATLGYHFTDDGEVKVSSRLTICPPECQSLPFRLGRHAHVDSYLAAHPFEN